MSDLLPPNATEYEKAVATVCSEANDLPIDIKKLWNPDECPENFLPWLAWALSVDFWDDLWPPEIKRNVIKASFDVHKIKGTPKSIKMLLEAAGYGEANIVEGRVKTKLDGTYKLDGIKTCGDQSTWADNVIIFNQAISNRMAEQFTRLFAAVAPARSRLHELRYHRTLKCDGEIKLNGNYKLGAFANA
jgi:phage tail P2-like protein